MRVSQAPYFSVLFTDWVWIWSVAGVLNSAVAVCVCVCVYVCSSLGCKTARAFPMSNVQYMILDREGGFVVVCVSRSSLFPVQWGLRARVASFADRRCGYQPCGGEILYGWLMGVLAGSRYGLILSGFKYF